MIRISRYSRDEINLVIKPDNNWFATAKNSTKEAIRDKKKHRANRNIYGHQEVRKALERLFHDKCAYCETRSTAGFDWDVEHYRPKGEVSERQNHPGYYWLTYEWKNLFPSCEHCNQFRIDKPRWNENINSRGGKSIQFPLKNENRRAMSHLANLNREEPLLLNPCKDYPESHFHFDITGQIHALNNSVKGTITIQLCHLKRSRLKKDRERELLKLIEFLKVINQLKAIGQNSIANDLENTVINTFLIDECIYAGMARYVYKYPWKFGI